MEMQLGCCCVTVPATINRPLYNGTPLNSDGSVAGYTANWEALTQIYDFDTSTYHTSFPPYYQLYGVQFTAAHVTAFGAYGANYQYTAKTRPFRWSFGGSSTAHPVVTGVCAAFLSSQAENRFTGPSANNHLGTVLTENVGCDPWIFAAKLESTYRYQTAVTATYMRVWIDSVDSSGIVPISYGSAASPIIALLASHDMTNAAVMVDMWFEATLFVPFANAFPSDLTPGMNLRSNESHFGLAVADGSYTWAASGLVRLDGNGSYSGGDIRKLLRKNWKLTFDRQGPGGTTELTLTAQSGWSISTSDGIITMTHAATGDIATVDSAREVPRIYITKPAAGGDASYLKQCVYSPSSGSEYEPIWRGTYGFSVPSIQTAGRGVVSRTTGATFICEGRASKAQYQGYMLSPPGSGASGTSINGAEYVDFPLTISMTPA